MSERRSNEERSRATRAALVSAARVLFEQAGYAQTSLAQVVERAGVSHGALYHHFDSKRALFAAVIDDIQRELADIHRQRVPEAEDPWQLLVKGLSTFAQAADRDSIRLVMLEAPAVLGYQGWREIDDRYFLAPTMALCETLIEQGVIAERPVEPLARVVLSISNSLGTMLTESEDPQIRDEILGLWSELLDGVRVDR